MSYNNELTSAKSGSLAKAESKGAAGLPDLGTFMRHVFHSTASAADDGSGGTALSRNYETAFDLLARASEAFQLLSDRCQQLEAELRGVKEKAWADVEAASDTTKQWQQLASALKMHLEDSEQRVGVLKDKLKDAEARLAEARERAGTADQQAASAMDLTIRFHDKIVAAFGIGSQAHASLDALAKGTLNDDRALLLDRS